MPGFGLVVYFLILLLLTFPLVFFGEAALPAISQLAHEFTDQDAIHAERMKHAPPITASERQFLQTTHFPMTVGIRTRRLAEANGLIAQLTATGLFDEVGVPPSKADLFADIEHGYSSNLGIVRGYRFNLSLRTNRARKVKIDVYVFLQGRTLPLT